jgi:hypothetical protein
MQNMSGAQLLFNYYDTASKRFMYRPIPQGNSVYSKLKELGRPTEEASYYSTDLEGDIIIVPIDESNYEHSMTNGVSTSTPIMIDLDSDLKMMKANSHDTASKSPRHSQNIDFSLPICHRQ